MISFFRLLLPFLLLLLPQALPAQLLLSGTVLEGEKHRPLPGVNVSTPAGTGTTTNMLGQFSLAVPDTGHTTLTFSMIGYQTVFLTFSENNAEIEVVLERKAIELAPALIRAYETQRPWLLTPGSFGVVGRTDIARTSETSLVPALNQLPGVKMEERAPASYRLSIRGSTLRAPFGVRNVKFYWNGVPFPEANETVPLNLIDAASVGRVEVVKGPGSSMYGAGTGGVVLLESIRPEAGEMGVEAGQTLGSYGLNRQTVTIHDGSENTGILVKYARQQYDGYRRHSAMDRHMLMLSSQFYPSAKNTIGVHTFYSNLSYQLPGGLTREQYEQDPRQVRPIVEQQNSSVNIEAVKIGMYQRYSWSGRWQTLIAIYGGFNFRDHPFVQDYVRSSTQQLGGRTRTIFRTRLGSIRTGITVGSEFQRGRVFLRTYHNRGGRPDTLRSDNETTLTQGLEFVQADLELPLGFFFTAGASLNNYNYEITRLLEVSNGDYVYKRSFNGILSPRVALLKRFSDWFVLHTSLSRGFSPPTEEELLPSNSRLNRNLQAEKGLSYEAGVKGMLEKQRFTYELTAFQFDLDQAIVSYRDSFDVILFRNAGGTRQQGLELGLNWVPVKDTVLWLQEVSLWSSYTYQHYRFREYLKDGQNFSGNALTGTSPHLLSAGLDLGTRPGFYFNLTAYYADEAPLNDANTVFSDAYLVFNTRAGWRGQFFKRLQAEIFAGADNLTDRKYSLGNDLNAFGGRYFQAAPARSFYAGASLKYRLQLP